MFSMLSDMIIRRGWVILLGWLVLSVLLFLFAPPWEVVTRDDDVRVFPQGSISVVGQSLLERGFPKEVSNSSVVIIGERRDGKLTPADFEYLDGKLMGLLGQARQDEPGLGIRRIDNHASPIIGSRLVGMGIDGSGQAALTILTFRGTYLSKATRAAVNRLQELLKTLPPPPEGLRLALTGSAVVGHDINEATSESFSKSTYTTIALVVGILLVVYRSPILALIPLMTITLAAFISFKSIALLTLIPGLNFQVMNITHIFIINGLFGAGTDYCLFLIARYREELIRGRTTSDALREAIVQVGGALVASAGTVMVGMGTLWFSTFAKIRYTGPALAWSLAIALLSSLTLAPVLVYWLRGAVFWPFAQPRRAPGHELEPVSLEPPPPSGFWAKVANLVVGHPVAILSLCVLVMAPLAVVGAGSRPYFSQLADLSEDQPSVLGSRTIQRYFVVGELSPTAILIEDPTLDFRSDEGRRIIDGLSRKIAAIPDVAEVRSISRPLGKRIAAARSSNSMAPNPLEKMISQVVTIFPGGRKLYQGVSTVVGLSVRIKEFAERAAVDPRYVGVAPADVGDRNHITRIDVVFKSDPFSDDSLDSLEKVHATLQEENAPGRPLAGATAFGMVGATSIVEDLKRATTTDKHRMFVLVTLGIYAILVILLRRPGICLYLIVTVVFGYVASLGLTELVFRFLHNGPEPWVGLDWKVYLFLFVILVAVGEDYNIFLMARVIEEEKKYGVIEGTRRAVAYTGGIISSCGLIVAGTYASCLTASLTTLRELGFALGVGVVLDTFLVRPILVPAFLVLMDRYRTWRRASARLHGAKARAGIGSGQTKT